MHQGSKKLLRSTRSNFYRVDDKSGSDHFYGPNDQSGPANFYGHAELDDDDSPLGRQARPFNSTSAYRIYTFIAY